MVVCHRLKALRDCKDKTMKRFRTVLSFVCLSFFFAAICLSQNQLRPGPYGTVFHLSTATDTATLTTNQIVGVLTGTPTAAANYTTPTAANICAALPRFGLSSAGTNTNDMVHWFIKNTSGGANTITLVAGSGVTIVGTATIAQNVVRHYLVVPTACPNPATGTPTAAVSIVSVSGAGAF